MQGSWSYTLFVMSFLAALGASISMVVHAYNTRGSGDENIYTPLLMACVKAMKIPELVHMYHENTTTVHALLIAGAAISCVIWIVALSIAASS